MKRKLDPNLGSEFCKDCSKKHGKKVRSTTDTSGVYDYYCSFHHWLRFFSTESLKDRFGDDDHYLVDEPQSLQEYLIIYDDVSLPPAYIMMWELL